MSGDVLVTHQIKSALADFFSQQEFTKILILVDQNTEAHCLPEILDALPVHYTVTIKAGEVFKTLTTCEQIWESMTRANLDRKALMINLGGGVIGDMGGFCASTYKRGIRFINIPTTLLSQVDASVGGKLGIDFHGYKNHIGVFNKPMGVFIDQKFLDTLPGRELRSGFAEVIKHGIIKDRDYFEKIRSAGLDRTDWNDVIEQSVAIKSDVVNQDPKENGLRKILNFGHTVGHGIETTFLDSDHHLLHGEAIAMGMIMEAYLSQKKCGLSQEAVEEINTFLVKIYEPNQISQSKFEEILGNIMQDKKNSSDSIRMSLLKDIGSCTYDIPVSKQDVLDSLFYFNQLLSIK